MSCWSLRSKELSTLILSLSYYAESEHEVKHVSFKALKQFFSRIASPNQYHENQLKLIRDFKVIFGSVSIFTPWFRRVLGLGLAEL